MPSGQRCWRTSAKHLASSNSPERLTRSDAGMIARAPCMKTAAAHHPIRSLARRLPAPLPLITPEANKSHAGWRVPGGSEVLSHDHVRGLALQNALAAGIVG